ncbi:MAG: hypothetical protein JKY92_10110 [Magnetovibrio sp.]|nr:hypothetical protein [Magnetovibrio sp.]
MDKSLFRQEILPFLGQFSLLLIGSILGGLVLDIFQLEWIGRWLGIAGILLIMVSFLYSLRKRKIITFGNPKFLLKLHEVLTWIGSLFVLVHADLHFNAILPWIAMIGMVLNVLSGMVGQRLLHRSKMHLTEMQKTYRLKGMNKEEIDQEIFWDCVTYDLMAKWRVVHFPISLAFAVITLGHILSILLFWEWK